MATRKFLDLAGLQEYDALIKEEIASGDSAAKSYADSIKTTLTNGTTVVKEAEHATTADTADAVAWANVSGKPSTFTPSAHNHDDRYYTESEIDTKVTALQTSINGKANSTHTHAIDDVTGLQTALDGKASSTHNHDTAYDKKGAADTALASAKSYADEAATTVKNDLLNGAGEAYDTLKELGDLIDANVDAIDALETVAAGKADKNHTHTIANVTGLQSALDGKADSSHGTHVSYSTTAPVMDGTAAVGTATTVARSDHKHPTDTSRAAKTDLDSHTGNTTVHITASERTTWNAALQASDITTGSVNGSISVKGSDVAVKGLGAAAYKAVDTSLSTTSTNLVTNKVVATAINSATSAISANTTSIEAHTTAIGNLQTAMNEIQEITTEEISALFA